jgi:hypothetical protein
MVRVTETWVAFDDLSNDFGVACRLSNGRRDAISFGWRYVRPAAKSKNFQKLLINTAERMLMTSYNFHEKKQSEDNRNTRNI